MPGSFIARLRGFARGKNLLLLNAVFCLCYPIMYTLLIILPHGEQSMNNRLHTSGVVFQNILFLLILTLNLNTISVVYRLLHQPVKKIVRTAYIIVTGTWIFYMLMAYYCTFFIPGFISHFHHYTSLSFRSIGWSTTLISVIFIFGLGILFTEYYRQIGMPHILAFIIPAIIHFACKNMLPFLLTMMGWVAFCGCQLLLYYSIVDRSWMGHNKTGYGGNVKYLVRED